MDESIFVERLLARLQSAIERRGRRVGYDDLFGDVGLAWAERLRKGHIQRQDADRFTWGIVHKTILRFHRSQKLRRHSPLESQGVPSRESGPVAVLLRKELDEALLDVLQSLPTEDREFITRRHDGGSPGRMRGGPCGSTARSRYCRIIKRARQHKRVATMIGTN
jgi:DNA-directed RNA polymerase specialized sigma24 family protein